MGLAAMEGTHCKSSKETGGRCVEYFHCSDWLSRELASDTKDFGRVMPIYYICCRFLKIFVFKFNNGLVPTWSLDNYFLQKFLQNAVPCALCPNV